MSERVVKASLLGDGGKIERVELPAFMWIHLDLGDSREIRVSSRLNDNRLQLHVPNHGTMVVHPTDANAIRLDVGSSDFTVGFLLEPLM